MHLLAFGIGSHELIVILIIVVILFGTTRLPQIGSAIGQGIKNFKRGMREVKAEEEEAKRLDAEKEKQASSGEDKAEKEKQASSGEDKQA